MATTGGQVDAHAEGVAGAVVNERLQNPGMPEASEPVRATGVSARTAITLQYTSQVQQYETGNT